MDQKNPFLWLSPWVRPRLFQVYKAQDFLGINSLNPGRAWLRKTGAGKIRKEM
jgi:hypothetical protein